MEYIKIIDTPERKTSEIIKQMKEKFAVWSYIDLDKIDKEFPAPKEKTTRYFLKTVEPDEALRGKSARDVGGMECITLRERLLMELEYFNETGKHLDIKGFTICAGSRYSDGYVPYVFWRPNDDGLGIDWYDVGSSGDDYAARAAVLSPNPFPLPPSNPSLEKRVSELERKLMEISNLLK